MIVRLAADAVDAAPNVLGEVLRWGPAGVMLLLILTGWLVTKGAYETMRADRDEWKSAYKGEADAHQKTRDALVDANRSASAAVETARTATGLLDKLGHASHPGGPL